MARRVATAKTPICATSAEPWRAPGSSRRGFTLVELVVALAVAALFVSLVPPALEKLRQGMHYRDTVRIVVAELRAARQQALVEGVETRFFVDLAERRYGRDVQALKPLPEPLQMRVIVAGIEWSQRQLGAIRFLPQGGSTGGSVDVLRPGGGGVRITVDWLSASVAQSVIDE